LLHKLWKIHFLHCTDNVFYHDMKAYT
jgi:hypothetical protein